jgi:hypothetical protein
LTDAVVIPTWAIGLFAGMLGIMLAMIRWSFIRFTSTIDDRLKSVEDTTTSTDRRLLVVETILNDGGGGTDPAARRLRALTPPQGAALPR